MLLASRHHLLRPVAILAAIGLAGTTAACGGRERPEADLAAAQGRGIVLSSTTLTDFIIAEAGVAMVIYPVTLLRSAMGAAERVLDAIKEEGTQQSQVEQMLTRARLYELVDYEGYNAFDTGIFNFDVPTLDIDSNRANL